MRTLHLISHTHWDREWYLTFQQFRLKLVRLVDGLFDLLERDEHYCHFMLDGQTIVLEDYLEIRPEREGDLRRHIQSGRLLVGPWYQLPDEFLVSPEATVRNLLEGGRVAGRFGPMMQAGYIPDPFGHIGQMPQILRGFGIGTAAVMRGLADQPLEFWWQSPDGSRVLMSFLRDSYGAGAGLLNAGLEAFPAQLRAVRDSLAPHSAAPHLLIMQGMDHMEPHPDTSAAVAGAAGNLDEDVLVHSTLPDYFDGLLAFAAEHDLPVVQGELRACKRHPLLPGVLSTRMWIKQRNAACENLLERWAEPFSAWAGLALDAGSPASRPLPGRVGLVPGVLRQAWRLLMQCHPHDSICGCSIDQVHEEMRPRFDQVEQIGEEITRQSLEALAGQIDTRLPAGCSTPLVVFNSADGPRSDAVSLVLEKLPESGAFDIVDENGAPLAYQTVGLGSRELFNMVTNRREFREAFALISEGRVMEFRFQDMRLRREGERAELEVILSEKGETDMALFAQGYRAVQEMLEDPTVKTYHVIGRSTEATRVLLAARDIPARGYRTLWVRGKPAESKAPAHLSPLAAALLPIAGRLAASPVGQWAVKRLFRDPSTRPPYRIENEFFVVEAVEDGTLTVLDKRSRAVFRGLNRFVDGGDRGDTYNYSRPEVDPQLSPKLAGCRVEHGAAQSALVLDLLLNAPEALSDDRKARAAKAVEVPIRCRVTLTTGVPRVDVHAEVENTARDHRLRVHFPAPFPVDEANYDGHYQIVRRAVDLPAYDSTWTERPVPTAPARDFTEISDGKIGLLVAGRGLPEVEVLRVEGGSEIALTLLRCVGWLSRGDYPERQGHAGPATATPGAQLPGRWSFDYAVIPSSGDLAAARIQARAFQSPLRAVVEDAHPGPLPGAASFLEASPGEFVISAVKAAQDGSGWIVRGYSTSAAPVQVNLRPLFPVHAAFRANLAEEQLEEIALPVWLPVKPFEIVTVLFV